MVSTSSSSPAARHCRATSAPSTLTYLSPAASLAADSAVARSARKVTPSGGDGGGRWVSTNCGPCHVPSNAPSWSVPRFGSSPEYVRAPTSSAPISPTSASTSGLGPRYGRSHDMFPPGPAMKPSTDMVTEYSTLAMPFGLPHPAGLIAPEPREHGDPATSSG